MAKRKRKNPFKPEYKSHAYYDREWSKLTREYKAWGLSRALQHKRRIEYNRRKLKETWRLREEAKKEGKKCYCFPKESEFFNPHEHCDWCKWRMDEDRINTPG